MRKEHSCFYFLFCLLLIPTFQGCNDCHLSGDCNSPGASTKIVFLKDGNDVLFGDDPLISISDFKIEEENDQFLHYDFTKVSELNLGLFSSREYHFIIGDLDTLSLIGETRVVESGECCDTYEFDFFTLDGVVICTEDCQILEINL